MFLLSTIQEETSSQKIIPYDPTLFSKKDAKSEKENQNKKIKQTWEEVNQERTSNLELPQEILTYIFQHLLIIDYRNIALVSKQWNEAFNQLPTNLLKNNAPKFSDITLAESAKVMDLWIQNCKTDDEAKVLLKIMWFFTFNVNAKVENKMLQFILDFFKCAVNEERVGYYTPDKASLIWYLCHYSSVPDAEKELEEFLDLFPHRSDFDIEKEIASYTSKKLSVSTLLQLAVPRYYQYHLQEFMKHHFKGDIHQMIPPSVIRKLVREGLIKGIKNVPAIYYTEEVLIECLNKGNAKLKDIPEEKRTYQVCLFAANKFGLEKIFKALPKQSLSKEQLQKIYLSGIEYGKPFKGVYRQLPCLNLIPEEDRTFEICLAAVQSNPYSLKQITDDQFTEKQLKQLYLGAMDNIVNDNEILLDTFPKNKQNFIFYLSALERKLISFNEIPLQNFTLKQQKQIHAASKES